MSEFQTPEPITAVIDLAMGDVRVLAGDRQDTVVKVQPSDSSKRADVEAADQTRVEYDAGRLLVKTTKRWKSYSPFSGGGSVDIEVALPTGSRVNCNAAMATVQGTGWLGDCRVKTAVGEIHLEQAATVKLTSSAGDISVGGVAGDAELSTSSGEVRIDEIAGAAEIKNSNGSIHVGKVGGDLRVVTANGAITVEDARGSLTAKTARGEIRIGAVQHGAVVAETGFGAVEVGVREGSAAWLDLNTHFGQLHSALDAVEPPEAQEDRVELRARTGFGDITIRRSHAATAMNPAGGGW